MRFRWRILGFGAALLFAPFVFAGSYLHSQGDLNSSAGVGILTSDSGWNDVRTLEDADCRTNYMFLYQFLEYGYSYYNTLYGGTSLVHASSCDDPDTKTTNTGIGDITLGIRGRLNQLRNHRAWEVELSVPTSGHDARGASLGCGSFALGGNVSAKETLGVGLELGGEVGVKLWEAPLSHEIEGRAKVGGPIGGHRSAWGWDLDVSGHAPLHDRSNNVASGLSDCGTTGSVIRGGVAIGYRVRSGFYVKCGLTSDVWGRDTSKRDGFLCGYSYLFKR